MSVLVPTTGILLVMTDAKKYLGIDYGHVRMGLAVGDSAARIARPLATLEKQSDPVAPLREVIGRERIDGGIVVGLPRGLDGQDTVQTGAVKGFAAALSALGTPVYFQDEAATSTLAAERLKAGGSRYRKSDIDAEAAAIILQDYLDSL